DPTKVWSVEGKYWRNCAADGWTNCRGSGVHFRDEQLQGRSYSSHHTACRRADWRVRNEEYDVWAISLRNRWQPGCSKALWYKSARSYIGCLLHYGSAGGRGVDYLHG